MKCIKIIKQNANEVRKILAKTDQINRRYKLDTDDEFVYIPLIDEYDNKINDDLKMNYPINIIDHTFKESKYKAKSFMDYLNNKIDPSKVEDIRKSFDIIGNIVILEIPPELEDEKYNIADAVLKFTKRRSIYYKKSNIQGIMRTRQLEFLAGVDDLETIHKEHGIRFKLNPTLVYFSPRLATERARIVNNVKEGEVIIDFFAGIGSFPISIAHKKDATIYSVDINPEAYYYVQENMKLNKLKGRVIPKLGDINDVIIDLPLADRILMNLPGTAKDFLPLAIDHMKVGGILNYYEFASDYDTVIKHVKDAAYPRSINVLNMRKVKSQSPGVWHIAADIEIL